MGGSLFGEEKGEALGPLYKSESRANARHVPAESRLHEGSSRLTCGKPENIITVHTTYFCGSVTAIPTSEGLVLIDTAKPETARQTLDVVRSWDNSPIHTVIFTHGHIDHTSGITVIDEEANARGVARPRIIAHRNVKRRMDRYEASRGFNSIVQGQQFNMPGYVYPIGQRRPDEVYDDTLALSIGGERIDLFHGRGETDDATFVWLPERRVLASGDFVIWVFPNAGNPRKVQRYAAEWAIALRQMEQLKPQSLFPAMVRSFLVRSEQRRCCGMAPKRLSIWCARRSR
ncbi:glyoxylase-like metal-dependent hydrolase (beta-lactamase superfamily II) [Mesorhizobium soli]|uniref:MBL fold metallo-hydrolase n=1 Tax=Pseudaminobacter soli (ex Li et al. 2025) TaxID=1295366 RepID=UPI002475B053|nr:MBL fold metallo-hydrolase [Mesorhizobium soli]MDH6230806.1 glyoxylase-like metal-dependent hydrolase (beta-lactamase superfamily II) [Mesorhizobium soli]